MFGIAEGLQLFSGLQGMSQAAGANRQSRKQLDESNAILERLKGLSTKSSMLADAFDPVQEAKQAEAYATKTAGKGFGMALDNWNADNIRGGGSVGSDTLNLTYANNLASKFYDPVRANIYETAANATNSKIATLGGAISQGQSLANAFINSSQANQIDPTGTMSLLSGAINEIGKKKAGTSGKSGSSASLAKGFTTGEQDFVNNYLKDPEQASAMRKLKDMFK